MKTIVLRKGDEVISKLTSIIDEGNIQSGLVIGLGALSEAEIMVYKLETKEYKSKKLGGALEVGNFSAVIGKDPEGKTHIHPHITLSNENFDAFTGHLKSGIVAATFEAVILENDQNVERYYDSEIGLNLIK